MIYLLDANVPIRAHEDYYPVDRIPQFWAWLAAMAERGTIKMPFEIHAEVRAAPGPLKNWLAATAETMVLDQKVSPAHLKTVLAKGYAPDLDDTEIEKLGRDPFLIAYALVDPTNTTVVTREVSAPSRQRANRKVPDVCKAVGVRCISDFALYRELKFSTA